MEKSIYKIKNPVIDLEKVFLSYITGKELKG